MTSLLSMFMRTPITVRSATTRADAVAQIKAAYDAGVSAALPPALRGIRTDPSLMGSRGRAIHYGRPEPDGRDYDYVYFTDDAQEQARIRRRLLRLIASRQWKRHDRPGGFLTASAPDKSMDVSVYPTSKRDDILKAWQLIEAGVSKDEAWEQVERDKVV